MKKGSLQAPPTNTLAKKIQGYRCLQIEWYIVHLFILDKYSS